MLVVWKVVTGGCRSGGMAGGDVGGVEGDVGGVEGDVGGVEGGDVGGV